MKEKSPQEWARHYDSLSAKGNGNENIKHFSSIKVISGRLRPLWIPFFIITLFCCIAWQGVLLKRARLEIDKLTFGAEVTKEQFRTHAWLIKGRMDDIERTDRNMRNAFNGIDKTNEDVDNLRGRICVIESKLRGEH